ncbi:TonB-dependent receptor [Flavitalea sp. BT771]|uniref:TonB-dependent receptor n=1 Tax=Flavitalea sp. BT771 TaxID=3063329 RepID=UPI0026E35114|nr:TonB-dependent receptor [Flavitalea sp. BT771]MDO6433672.1 TonB-dependent receptor [Flavitalea sp. BT771]MDV6222423.1 TonB-dependent receptor [Flavitalea sp. BT771]
MFWNSRLVLILSLWMPSVVVCAQSVDSATSLNEVVVTAQKREEPLGKVPIAVAAFTATQVQQFRLWNNKDISGVVPGLYAADPGDGRDVISIRGVTSTSYDPAVAVYVDGINQFGLDTYIPSLFDIQRIEILRGPQGTLYGRNAMGGVMNIITRQPTNQFSGVAEVSTGNYGLQRYVAAFRNPLVKNKLFIGAAGLYEGRNGYYTNEYDGSSYDRQHSFTGNYYLKYLPGPRWTLDLNVKQRNNRNHGAFPLVADPSMLFGQPFKLDQNARTTMVDNTFQSSLSAGYKGRGFNFKSQTSYQKNYRYYQEPIDGDFSPLDAISVINNYGRRWNNIKAFTEDIQFSSASSSNLKWTAGSYWFYQDQPNRQATRYGNDANLLGVGDSLFSTINTTRNHKWGMAFYGQLSYPISSRANLTAGLRYDYEHQREDVLGEYQHDPDPTPVVVIPDTSGRVSFHAFSPRLALDYQVADHSILYAVYSRGFRTGGLTQLSFNPSEPPLAGFRPEYSSNYEFGIKNSLLSGVLRVNADVFFTHINDAQVPTLILPEAITVTRNTGRLDNWGAEAEIAGRFVKGLEVIYNLGYTHSRYRSLKLSQNGDIVDLVGKRQLFTPDLTSLLAVQYGLSLREGIRAFVRGEWKMMGSTYFDLANTMRQSPYSIYNMRCGVDVRQFELAVWGRNIGDKKYISYAYDFGAYHLGDPATWGVTLGVRFGG